MGCVESGQEEGYRGLVDHFVKWCGENCLQLNVAKTKKIMVDMKKAATLSPVCTGGSDVEMVRSYKYLDIHLDDKLEWSTNPEAIYRKGLSWLYFLRRLRSFSVCNKMLHMFYHSVVASIIFYVVVY